MPQALLIQLDGFQYCDLGAPAMLDKMIKDKVIPPVVVVYLPPMSNRLIEYDCNDEFTDFLANRFVPELRERYHCSNDPADTIIAGSSMSGLAAFYTGLTQPQVFGHVISQSGALWSNREKVENAVQQFAQDSGQTTFIMDAGQWEAGLFKAPVSLLQANREMAQTMHEHGLQEQYHYHEFQGVGILAHREHLFLLIVNSDSCLIVNTFPKKQE